MLNMIVHYFHDFILNFLVTIVEIFIRFSLISKIVFLDYKKKIQKITREGGGGETCVYRGVDNRSPCLEMKNHTYLFY